jgi:hypothetical protein
MCLEFEECEADFFPDFICIVVDDVVVDVVVVDDVVVDVVVVDDVVVVVTTEEK